MPMLKTYIIQIPTVYVTCPVNGKGVPITVCYKQYNQCDLLIRRKVAVSPGENRVVEIECAASE